MIDAMNPAMLLTPELDRAAAMERTTMTGKTPAMPQTAGETPNFESLLMTMMVKEMRQSMGSELFPGDTSDILGSLFDMHLGDHMAEFAKLGMNESILGVLRNSSSPAVAPQASDSKPTNPSASADAETV